MSPDDIFAANMWPWPDPLIKRDAMGRILFVNAAFLQLYGGRVENWAGQILQGWPQPNPQGAPFRFETRAGMPPHDIIYDWVEVTMSDGHALAIARDITLFRKTPPAPETVTPTTAHLFEPQAESLPSANAAPAQPSAPAQPAIAEPPMTAPVAPPAPRPQQQPHAEPAFQSAPQPEPVPQTAPEPEPVSAAFEEPDYTPAKIEASEPAEQVQPPAKSKTPEPVSAQETKAAQTPAPELQRATEQKPIEPAPTPEPAAPPATRDFERRALPIENDEAVLGSNWRDAVIAKAIGADIAEASEEDSDAADPAAAESHAPQESSAPGEGLRILLAEDNAINALLTRTLLEAEGCSVETVEDGALAVKAAEANTYDLVFMDMRMPNMDGLEATRKIRAMGARTQDLPIIALTANAFDDDRNACFDSGMNDFMTKPVSAEELSEMVATWTKKREEAKATKSA